MQTKMVGIKCVSHESGQNNVNDILPRSIVKSGYRLSRLDALDNTLYTRNMMTF